jgi:hypothetical protein
MSLAQFPILSQTLRYPVQKLSIGFGDFASTKTMKIMKDIIIKSSENPYIRNWAESIVVSCPNDNMARAATLYNFLRSRTRYCRDMEKIEFIKTPPVSLQLLEVGGTPLLDCDDYTVLSLSLLSTLGYITKIRAVAYSSKRFEHVYGLCLVQGDYVPFDLVNPNGFSAEKMEIIRYTDLDV